MVNPDILTGRLGNRLFQIAFLYAQVRDGIIPDWYVQSPEYFDKYRAEIRQLFGEGIGSIDRVGIHVRRAANPINPNEPKYSENSFYVNLGDSDYYERAMALFPDSQFLIFTDDRKYCEERFKGIEINPGNELEDFNTLSSCKSIIGANSSFSWWAAYLSNAEKIVFPKAWYADKNETRTVCPSEWTRI